MERCPVDMDEFADIERRIELLCSPASLQCDDARRLAEIGDVLAAGYVAALTADARHGGLAETVERLLNEPGCADEARAVAEERRALEEATRRLRARLGLVRELFACVDATATARQTSPVRTA
jgi:hypothetical protein